MTWFTSARERQLWTWVLAILAAISASAVFAGSLVDVLGSQALLGVAFAAGFALAVAAVVGIGVRGPQQARVWVAVGVLAAVAMIPVRSGISALERTHVFEYGLFAVLLYEALAERTSHGARLPLPGLVAICIASLLGWLDEAVQALVPNRVYDLRDVVTNALAAGVAVSAVALIRWGRRRSVAASDQSSDANAMSSSKMSPSGVDPVHAANAAQR